MYRHKISRSIVAICADPRQSSRPLSRALPPVPSLGRPSVSHAVHANVGLHTAVFWQSPVTHGIRTIARDTITYLVRVHIRRKYANDYEYARKSLTVHNIFV